MQPHLIKQALSLAFTLILCGSIGACATSNSAKHALPVETQTTAEVIQGARFGRANDTRFTIAQPLVIDANQAMSTTAQQIADLNRDFKRVPNPDIIGFVYAHRAGEVPIPGYATIFPLYEREHYAIRTEGMEPRSMAVNPLVSKPKEAAK